MRAKVVAGRAQLAAEETPPPPAAPLIDRYDVSGVSLLGQATLPSQITSAAMVSFGANRNTVSMLQITSITLWGLVFGVLATFGVSPAG